jgi:hypothetical protein
LSEFFTGRRCLGFQFDLTQTLFVYGTLWQATLALGAVMSRLEAATRLRAAIIAMATVVLMLWLYLSVLHP